MTQSGEDTECQWIACDMKMNMHILMAILNNVVLVQQGLSKCPGDSLSAQVSTKCDAIMCDIGYRVQNHTCQLCEPW